MRSALEDEKVCLPSHVRLAAADVHCLATCVCAQRGAAAAVQRAGASDASSELRSQLAAAHAAAASSQAAARSENAALRAEIAAMKEQGAAAVAQRDAE